MSLKTDIERLKKLRDDLQRRANQIRNAAGGKNTPEVIALIDAWGEVKDITQELIDLGIDSLEEDIKRDLPKETIDQLKARLARNEEIAARKLKTALRREKKAIELLKTFQSPAIKPAAKDPQKKKAEKPAPKLSSVPIVSENLPGSYKEYEKKLNELKTKAEKSVLSQLPAIEKMAYQLAVDYVDNNLDTKGGRIVPNEAALLALNKFTDDFLGAFTKNQTYKGSVGQYLKNFKDLGTLMDEFQKSNGLDVKQARLGSVQEIVVAEVINRYSENGLNPGFVQPLRQILFANITGGMSKTEAMAQLRDYIQSGKDHTGKLGRYLEQTAQQGVDSYTGAVNTRIMQTFKIETYVMSGSLIATSSPQCRYVIEKLGGLIDRKTWPKVEEIAKKNGLIEGTTFDNLPLNKNHWGCRHEFTPIVLTPKQRQKILSNPVNN